MILKGCRAYNCQKECINGRVRVVIVRDVIEQFPRPFLRIMGEGLEGSQIVQSGLQHTVWSTKEKLNYLLCRQSAHQIHLYNIA